MTWNGYFWKVTHVRTSQKFVLVVREKNVSFPHFFAKFCRIYSFYNSLAESETNLTLASFMGSLESLSNEPQVSICNQAFSYPFVLSHVLIQGLLE